MAATKTKNQAARFTEHQWKPADVRKMYSRVNQGLKSGKSKMAMFEEVAAEMRKDVPNMTLAKVSARYYYHASSLRRKGKDVPVVSHGSTKRSRPAVTARAKARLTAEAAPAVLKPRGKASPPPVAEPSLGIKVAAMIDAHLGEAVARAEAAEAKVAAAEAALAKAEVRASRAEARLDKVRSYIK